MKLTSCCCFDLRTGGLIIGGIDVFVAVFLMKTGFLGPLIKFVVGACLIHGIKQNKAPFLTPYLASSLMTIVAYSVGTIYLMTANPNDVNNYIKSVTGEEPIDGMVTFITVGLVMLIAFSVYCWLVVFTLYQELSMLPFKIEDAHRIGYIPNSNQNVSTVENGMKFAYN